MKNPSNLQAGRKRVILSVTNDVYADHRLHKMARTLHESGFDVLILGKKTKQDVSKTDYAVIKRLPVVFKKSFFFYAEFNIRLFFYLLFCRADILTANDLDTLPANTLAARLRRKKLVYDSHEYFTQSPEILHKPFVIKFWSWLERICVKHITQGITVSPSIAKEYKAIYGKEFHVVRNVPERNRITLHTDLPDFMKHPKLILYQGSLNLGRGLEMAIDAMQYLEDYKLVIIGKGDIEKGLKTRADRLNLGHKVFFTGRVSYTELPAYTRKALIGLSVEEALGKNYEYALPNKLFDYIHAEVPAIVTNLPEMKAVVEKFKVGKILINNDARELARLISDMTADKQLMDDLKQNCKKASEVLCWEKESEIVKEIYANL